MSTKPPPRQVKFQEDKTSPSISEPSKKQTNNYRDASFCKAFAIDTYNEADRQFKVFTKNDPDVRRRDTAQGVIKILSSVKEALDLMNQGIVIVIILLIAFFGRYLWG